VALVRDLLLALPCPAWPVASVLLRRLVLHLVGLVRSPHLKGGAEEGPGGGRRDKEALSMTTFAIDVLGLVGASLCAWKVQSPIALVDDVEAVYINPDVLAELRLILQPLISGWTVKLQYVAQACLPPSDRLKEKVILKGGENIKEPRKGRGNKQTSDSVIAKGKKRHVAVSVPVEKPVCSSDVTAAHTRALSAVVACGLRCQADIIAVSVDTIHSQHNMVPIGVECSGYTAGSFPQATVPSAVALLKRWATEEKGSAGGSLSIDLLELLVGPRWEALSFLSGPCAYTLISLPTAMVSCYQDVINSSTRFNSSF